MSSYLSFYLVPKQNKTVYDKDGKEKEIKVSEGKPLLLTSYTRNSEIYQAYYENLHPAYIGTEDEDQYSELTYEDALTVVHYYEESIKKIKQRLKVDYKMLRENYNSELWEDIHSMEEYLIEQQNVLNDLKWLAYIVNECSNEHNDFEKVLMNID